MTSYQFPVIATTAKRSGRCNICGKRVVRSKRFEQTVNPYNRNAVGAQKTSQEVYEDVKREASAWIPDFTHLKCEGTN